MMARWMWPETALQGGGSQASAESFSLDFFFCLPPRVSVLVLMNLCQIGNEIGTKM